MCAEPLAARAERCFRCETPLGAWWRFDDALSAVGAAGLAAAFRASPASEPPPKARDERWLGFAVLLGGGALVGALATGAWMSRNGRSGASTVVHPAATPLAAVPAMPMPPATARPPSTSAPAAIASLPRPDAPRRASPVRYRVQRGDSLWRIAAALTGDGRRWRELWPDRTSEIVRAGEWLEAPVPAPALGPGS